MTLKRTIKKDGLQKIREMVDLSEDLDMLSPCLDLIRDMIEIENLKHQISLLQKNIDNKESKILEDERRMAYYIYMLKLSPEEISAVGDRVKGRMRVVENRKNKNKDSDIDK